MKENLIFARKCYLWFEAVTVLPYEIPMQAVSRWTDDLSKSDNGCTELQKRKNV